MVPDIVVRTRTRVLLPPCIKPTASLSIALQLCIKQVRAYVFTRYFSSLHCCKYYQVPSITKSNNSVYEAIEYIRSRIVHAFTYKRIVNAAFGAFRRYTESLENRCVRPVRCDGSIQCAVPRHRPRFSLGSTLLME